ncbi:MAG TPA: polysaccharide deacetylase family protein [Burkholderiales bacterium]|jgi:hypothetical protein|nr:polysaccharide deacetylase family protein [Burkholderiales bacterium]
MGAETGVVSWAELRNELAEWRNSGSTPDFWWRDDDAGMPTPALEQLLRLAHSSGVPLALAVVPREADRKLTAALDAGVSVIQHGADHVNRAGAGAKKSEFPDAEPAAAALERLASARKRLQTLAGTRFCPVLAPPWNRLSAELVTHLPAAKYAGLSQYGPRKRAAPAPGLRQVNTHVDIIAWQAGRNFVGADAALRMTVNHLASRRRGEVDRAEATGLLTHHACHDEGAWAFLERLFAFTREAGARWRSAPELFG